ncbi:putative RNase H-like HicB family nuclease [Actinokineospora baliensis]|uniref:type II toxin-antitoxin system HicB family antitoxin n=1 Tax=Actinokineospora baliensis TaxID=547056 RepID=UPI001956B5AA|nr:type II toxin-antitoxin system HicB family antitoxin [Actinokineospora baliensis]MBM7770581.1 putative RNase H-like HicB family nuclease [Actinokineospora baliensis]
MSEQWTFTAAVHQEEDWYIAQCLEVDVASQGPTIPEALANLREAVELYLAEVPEAEITPTPLVTSFQVPGTAA